MDMLINTLLKNKLNVSVYPVSKTNGWMLVIELRIKRQKS